MNWPLLSTVLILFLRECRGAIHEIREIPLRDAEDRKRIDGDAVLPVRIALRPNTDALSKAEEWLMVRLSN